MARRSPFPPVLVFAAAVAAGVWSGTGASAEAGGPDRSLALPPLRVEDAVALALRRNLDLQGSCLDHQASRDALSSAWGVFDPRLSSSASATGDYASPPGASVSASVPWGGTAQVQLDWLNAVVEEDGRITQAAASAPTVSLSISQPLLSGFVLSDALRGLREAQGSWKVSSVRLEQAVTELAAQVEDAYWGRVLAGDDLSAALQSLSFSDKQEQVTRSRIDEGFQAPTDLLQVQEERARAEAAAEDARARLADAEDTLRVMLDLPLPGAGEPALDLVSRPEGAELAESVEDVVEAATTRGFEVRAAAIELARQRAVRHYERGRALPDLSADAGATWVPDGADPSDSRPDWEWSIGATLSLPLSPREALLKTRAADRAVRQAELGLREARREAERAARAARRALANQSRQAELAELRVGFAERKLKAEHERLDRGESTLKNVLDFLADRDQAVRDANSARIALRGAWVDVLKVEAALLPRYGIDLHGWLEGCARRGSPRSEGSAGGSAVPPGAGVPPPPPADAPGTPPVP